MITSPMSSTTSGFGVASKEHPCVARRSRARRSRVADRDHRVVRPAGRQWRRLDLVEADVRPDDDVTTSRKAATCGGTSFAIPLPAIENGCVTGQLRRAGASAAASGSEARATIRRFGRIVLAEMVMNRLSASEPQRRRGRARARCLQPRDPRLACPSLRSTGRRPREPRLEPPGRSRGRRRARRRSRNSAATAWPTRPWPQMM